MAARIPISTALALLPMLFTFCANAAGHAVDHVVQRQTFKLAEKALQSNQRTLYNQLSKTLPSYPLYPYLLYRDLDQRLDTARATEVRAFLDTYDGTAIARRLRKSWLKQHAEAKRWSDYLEDYRPLNSTLLSCYHRRALLETGRRSAALDAIETIWMSGVSLPNGCDPVFDAWQEQGGFTPERVWRRLGLALENAQLGLARYLQKQLPETEQELGASWIEVHRNPHLILSTAFDPADPRSYDILLHGLNRWSETDSVAATAALDHLKARYPLPQDEVNALARKLALYLASRGHPQALARLTALPPALVDEQVEAWRVRIFLRRRDWPGVLKWLDAMQSVNRDRPQWRYWRARALVAATGDTVAAERLYQELATLRDYYGFLAADRSGLPYRIESIPLGVDPARLAALAQRPAIQRARELFLLGRYREARAEWDQATAGLERSGLATAAKLAQSWGWYERAITTLARAGYRDDLELRFPLPHRRQISSYAHSRAIDPAWIYAVMRQESLFRPDAKSPAGALGLMQIMPGTGRRIAATLKVNLANNHALLATDTNIRFGTFYLRDTLDKLQDNPLLATAAYNAGPYRVAGWLPEHGPVEADLWVETIPFFETRKYVKRIMEYATVYQHRLGAKGGSMQQRMATVQPSS